MDSGLYLSHSMKPVKLCLGYLRNFSVRLSLMSSCNPIAVRRVFEEFQLTSELELM
ncbi:hypothetical protein YC2023_087596 [Brassica napus]